MDMVTALNIAKNPHTATVSERKEALELLQEQKATGDYNNEHAERIVDGVDNLDKHEQELNRITVNARARIDTTVMYFVIEASTPGRAKIIEVGDENGKYDISGYLDVTVSTESVEIGNKLLMQHAGTWQQIPMEITKVTEL